MTPRLGLGLIVALLLGLLVWGAYVRPEPRLFALLGLLLCGVLFAGVLYRPTRWLASGLTLALAALLLAVRPLCVPIPAAELANFSPIPIEQRTDVSGYFPVFQQQPDGSWHQCKMAVSRWFFF